MTARSRLALVAPVGVLVAAGAVIAVASYGPCSPAATGPDAGASPTAHALPDGARDAGAPLAEVRGSVRDAGSGAPIPGARVWAARPIDPRDPRSAADALAAGDSDAGGAFRLGGLPDGSVEVLAVAPGFARESAWVVLRRGETAVVELALGPGAALAGVVVDTEGDPVPEALLLAEAPADGAAAAAVAPRPWIGTSGPDGAFAVEGLPPGTYELRALREGFVEVTLPDLVPPRADLRIVLDSIGRLDGMVFDGFDGAPMPYARVSIGGSGLWPPREVTADGAGFFRALGLPEGVYEVRAEGEAEDGAPRASPVIEGVSLGAGVPAQTLDLAVEPARTLAGRVVAPDGRPVAGARLVLGVGALRVLAVVAVSDDAGAFSFPALLPETYALDVWAPGWAEVRGLPVAIAAEPDEVPALVVPLAGARVTGVVVDAADGLALPGAEIALEGEEPGHAPFELSRDQAIERERLWAARLGDAAGPPAPVEAFASDAAGAFGVSGVPPGARVRVRAALPGYAPAWSAPVTAPFPPLRIALARGVTVAGRARDEGGVAVEGVVVRADSDGEGGGAAAVTDAAGAFALHDLGGHVTLLARAPGWVGLAVDLGTPAPGAVVERDLVLARSAGPLRGRVVDERGFGVEGAEIVAAGARPGPAPRSAGLSDAFGDFVLADVEPGPLAVTVTHPDYAPVSLAGVTGGERAEPLRVVLGAGGAIAGTVVDAASGLDVPAFTVELRGGAGGAAERRTFTGGAFRWEGLAPATYVVRVLAPPYAPAERRARVDPPAAGAPSGAARPDVEIAFALAAAGGIAGEVREAPSGTPLPGMRVAAYRAGVPGEDPGAPAAVARSGADGAFRLDGLAPGDYLLFASDAEHEDARAGPLHVAPGETTDFVTLAPRMRRGAGGGGPGDDGAIPGTVRLRLGLAGGAHAVAEVTPGSTAAAAGVLRGDVLLAVDDVELEGLPLAEAATLLAGPAGSEVTLLLLRPSSDERFEVRVAREPAR